MIFFIFVMILVGCVGPTSPFGAIHTLKVPEKTKNYNDSTDQPKIITQNSKKNGDNFFSPIPKPVKIEIFPKRQVLHGRKNLKLSINDPKGINSQARWRAFYNGYEITQQLIPFKNELLGDHLENWNIEFKNIRLRPEINNIIQFSYLPSAELPPIVQSWSPPECSIFQNNLIQTTEHFEPDIKTLEKKKKWSIEHSTNPSLLVGLVAQESAFNPKAISWAKAMGLTQITPLGDRQISSVHPNWPRSEIISKYPAPILKVLIKKGKINSQNDWRLNPELSIRGGLTLLDYMQNYWMRNSHLQFVHEKINLPNYDITPIILASYHSGAARVKRAIKEKGINFLSAKYLNEARKYVGRVSSYCYHFSNPEAENAQTP